VCWAQWRPRPVVVVRRKGKPAFADLRIRRGVALTALNIDDEMGRCALRAGYGGYYALLSLGVGCDLPSRFFPMDARLPISAPLPRHDP
jgi:hypothetical protein